MDYLKSLLHQCCERCEEGKFETCQCYMTCPVYGLYVEARKKEKVKVVKIDDWSIPPSPINEII